jgi:hypothetical protein
VIKLIENIEVIYSAFEGMRIKKWKRAVSPEESDTEYLAVWWLPL